MMQVSRHFGKSMQQTADSMRGVSSIGVVMDEAAAALKDRPNIIGIDVNTGLPMAMNPETGKVHPVKSDHEPFYVQFEKKRKRR